MVDYVEKLGSHMAMANTGDFSDQGRTHLKKVIGDIESTLLRQLGRTNISADVLGRIEAQLNTRLESALDRIRLEWLQTQAGMGEKTRPKLLSVMQTLEYNVGDDKAREFAKQLSNRLIDMSARLKNIQVLF